MPLRNECGMNIHRPVRAKTLSDDAKANIARIQQIWTECRTAYARAGPYLFGAFAGADAMFAPVVHRFLTYAIEVTPVVGDYMYSKRAFYCTGWARGWPRRRVTPGPSGIIGTA